MTVVIDGKKVASQIKSQLKIEVEEFKRNGGECGLAVIIVGENPASKVYVRNKIASCAEVGIKSYHYELSEETDEEEIIKLIEELNENKEVYGILVQLPLPKKFNERRVLAAINPEKDVDGFSSYQMGKLVLGEECFPSCTPRGIIELLHAYNIPLEGKRAVVVGRSNTVGKPMAIMLLKENATVTVAHSRTQNLGELTSQADILVVAIGKARFIKENMVKEGAVVIDVGMNRVDGKLCGDVDFEAIKDKCSYITPVPGGVGPMTVTMLLKNTVDAAHRNG